MGGVASLECCDSRGSPYHKDQQVDVVKAGEHTARASATPDAQSDHQADAVKTGEQTLQAAAVPEAQSDQQIDFVKTGQQMPHGATVPEATSDQQADVPKTGEETHQAAVVPEPPSDQHADVVKIGERTPQAMAVPEPFDQPVDVLKIGEHTPLAASVPEPSTPSDGFSQRDAMAELSECESNACEKVMTQQNLHPSMTVEFQNKCGSTEVVIFTERPVGLNFGPMAHWSREVKKVAPGSHAEEAGVQAGWSILTINGESLAGVDEETIHKKFGDAVSVLSFPKHMMNRRSSWDDLSTTMASSGSSASSECSLPLS